MKRTDVDAQFKLSLGQKKTITSYVFIQKLCGGRGILRALLCPHRRTDASTIVLSTVLGPGVYWVWNYRRYPGPDLALPGILDLKDTQFKCVYLQNPAVLGYSVNKQDACVKGEGRGGRVGVTELQSGSTTLYCLHHPSTQYTLCVQSWIDTLTVL